ncbi:MAG TPA: hypothetical protein VFM05_04625 [Candidatus Saccharimonadales bacterium]|nr:hypothetical protein [Candidatus Saccharimonadales bacterium]
MRQRPAKVGAAAAPALAAEAPAENYSPVALLLKPERVLRGKTWEYSSGIERVSTPAGLPLSYQY